MLKLDLEKAEEPEIKLPTSAGSSKKQESSHKTSAFALLTTPKPLTVWKWKSLSHVWLFVHNKLWKILKEMGITYHLTCLLRNLYSGQEATDRIRHGTMNSFQIGKAVRQDCRLSPCLCNFYAEYIMQNAGLGEAQARIKNCWEKYQQPQICRWYHTNGRKCQGAKSLLMKVKKESKKAGLKLSIHLMANRSGKNGSSDSFLFFGAPKSMWTVTTIMKLKDAYSLEEKLWQT